MQPKIFCLVFIVMLAMATAVHSGHYAISPVKDSSVHSHYDLQDTNMGLEGEVASWCDYGSWVMRFYMTFDLSAIAPSEDIDGLTLLLYQSNGSGFFFTSKSRRYKMKKYLKFWEGGGTMRFKRVHTAKNLSGGAVVLAFCFAAIILFGFCKIASAGYCASGDVEVQVYWSVSQGVVGESYQVKCVDEELSIDISEDLTGPYGNTAGALSIASLPVAWQTAFGSGITPDVDAGMASGRANNRLQDRIIFTVPAGTYVQDVVVGLRGRVSGFFTMTGDGTGRATYDACFVAGNCVDWEWEDEDGWAFSRNYYLPYRLVVAGTTLVEPRIRSIGCSSRMSIRGQSYGGQENSGTSEISSAIHIRSSHDIAWTSESGAFGSNSLSQGDNDFDGDVDGSDLAAFTIDCGRDDCIGDCDADFDFDGRVDNLDLAAFAGDFGMID